MKIKYGPVSWNPYAKLPYAPDTAIVFVNENTVSVDGESYEFDADSVVFPDIWKQTDGVIQEAHRDSAGELWLTVRRFYTDGTRPEWDTGDYHEIHG